MSREYCEHCQTDTDRIEGVCLACATIEILPPDCWISGWQKLMMRCVLKSMRGGENGRLWWLKARYCNARRNLARKRANS